MIALLSAIGSLLSFRLRSRASLEIELIALRHQVTVLRRQRPGRPTAFITGPAAVGVALPDLAASHRCDGIGQAGNRCAMASQGFPPALALAITPSGTTQQRNRDS